MNKISYKVKTFSGQYLKYLSRDNDVTLTDYDNQALVYETEDDAKIAALTIDNAYIIKEERILVD